MQEIDISCYQDVVISIDHIGELFNGHVQFEDDDNGGGAIFGCQNNNIDNSHDQIQFAYLLDGVEIFGDYVSGTTEADFTGNWTSPPINGTTLQIKVYVAAISINERIYFESLTVTAASAMVDAGAAQMRCNGDLVNLSATGNGTWSGGAGSFSNILDPNATYTPAAGEDNSTVVLTYQCSSEPGCAGSFPPPMDDVQITFAGPDATLAYQDPAFTGLFCDGACETLDVAISGGTQPYQLEMSLSVGPINFPFPIPGFNIGETITVCYDQSSILPGFDLATNTLTVPGPANGFSGTINLTSITDANGCSQSLTESLTATFQSTPEIFPATLNACADATGLATFMLSDADGQVDPSATYTVEYFQFSNMTGQIAGGQYMISGNETIYAFATDNGCISDPQPVTLIVLPAGDVGQVDLFCDVVAASTSCLDVCDFDNDGSEVVDVTVLLSNAIAGSTYEVTYESFPGGISTVTFVGSSFDIPIVVAGYTSVEILSVTEVGLCEDVTGLGTFVELNLVARPDVDPISDVIDCSGSYVLPMITGTDLSGSSSYYTVSNASGTAISPGTIITMDTALYIYDGIAGCDDEEFFTITVGDSTTYDEVADIFTCGVYTLPTITGTNVGAEASYYSGPSGSGTQLPAGTSITMDQPLLFIYDPSSSCATNEPSFSVMVTAGDTLLAIVDTIVCDSFRLPPIRSQGALSGDEAYYTGPGASGDQLAIDSLILLDSLLARLDTNSVVLYAFDSIADCRAEQSFRLTIQEPSYAGRDSLLSYCSTLGERLNLMVAAADPLLGGSWTTTAPLPIGDSTDVNLGALTAGTYTYTYTIIDTACGDQSSTVTIEVSDGAFAGLDGAATFCENELPLDLYLLFAATDQSGVFSTVPDVGFDFGNPTAATFDGLTNDVFDILYVVDSSTPGCSADTATFSVTINSGLDAGRDSSISVCQGSSVDLLSLTSGDAGGTFSEVSPGSGFTPPSTVNTAGLVGTFGYHYIVTDPCGIDTALLTIDVSTSAEAGDGGMREICDGSEDFDLGNILANADAGGQFFIDGALVSPTITPDDFTPPFVVEYIVGDGITCDFDTATFDVNVISAEFDLVTSSQAICPNRAQFVTIRYTTDREYTIFLSTTNNNSGSSTSFTRLTEPGEDDIVFQVSNDPDGIERGRNLEPDNLYTLRVDSIVTSDGSCTITFDDVQVPVRTASVFRFELDTTICRGDSVFFLNRFYTNSVYDSLQTTDGCDSIVDLDITFLRQDTITIDGQRCFGDQVDVGGTIFDENTPTGQILLQNTVGCDSLIVVDLDYVSENAISITDTICDGGQVVIAGEVFDMDRTTGMVRSTGLNGDCDTVFMVDLTIGSASTLVIDDVLCVGSSITVGGELFDSNRPSGEVTLSTVDGCDSTITVDLTFAEETIIPVNDAICPGDTVFVNGTAYFLGNDSGTEQVAGLAGDCDTVFQIALVEAADTEGMLDVFTCNPDSIIILGSLMLSIDNPTGSFVVGQNAAGCDSIVMVTATYGNLRLDVLAQPGAAGTELNLLFEGLADSIVWSPVNGLSCIDCTTPTADPAVTTEYFVQVFAGGCTDSARVLVRVEAAALLDFPSVIRPEGSPGNDVFYVKAPPEDSIMVETMIIYDRWGNNVFSVSNVPAGDPAFGWNGTYVGRDVAQGVYAYYIELSSAVDPQYSFSRYGDITVLR